MSGKLLELHCAPAPLKPTSMKSGLAQPDPVCLRLLMEIIMKLAKPDPFSACGEDILIGGSAERAGCVRQDNGLLAWDKNGGGRLWSH